MTLAEAAAARAERRRAYHRARSRALHKATEALRSAHRAEYTRLLTEALREEGLA